MENQLIKNERTADIVLEKIQKMENLGQIYFPKNYSPENALKSAWLILQETVDRNKAPVLQSCTKESIANALFNMAIQGLNPAKKQCYFIAYGKQLQLTRSYFGTMAIAKQFGELEDITSEVVYEGDVLEYEIKRGKTIIKSHTRSFGNMKKEKIVGAYATLIYKDAEREEISFIMTIEQIKISWSKSKSNINDLNSVHMQFTEDMSKRTVINKICKYYINTKNDDNLDFLKKAFENTIEEQKENEVAIEIEEKSNKIAIDFKEENEEIQILDGDELFPAITETQEVEESPDF